MRPVRRSQLLALSSAIVACAGVPAGVAEPTGDGHPCVPRVDLVVDDAAPAAGLYEALGARDWAAAQSAGERLLSDATDEAVRVFHGTGATSEARRSFFDRWVFAVVPTLSVLHDRFVLHPDVGVALAFAATQRGDLDAAARWLDAAGGARATDSRVDACLRWVTMARAENESRRESSIVQTPSRGSTW